MNFLVRSVLVGFFAVSVVYPISGCSNKKSTVSSEVTTAERADVYGNEPEVKTVEVRNETVEEKDEDRGILHIVGDIIALPFRAVGALVSAIF